MGKVKDKKYKTQDTANVSYLLALTGDDSMSVTDADHGIIT